MVLLAFYFLLTIESCSPCNCFFIKIKSSFQALHNGGAEVSFLGPVDHGDDNNCQASVLLLVEALLIQLAQ